MLILFINTVLSPNGVSLFSSKGECLAEKTWEKAQSHSEKLFPALEAIFKKAKKTWHNLDAICVVNGPGPFTSLRVGISLANAAGFALNIPVYSVSPLSFLTGRSLQATAPDQEPDPEYSLPQGKTIASDQESLKSIFSKLLDSNTPKIKPKTPFKPVLPIYGQEPNISKPRHLLTAIMNNSFLLSS